MAELGGVLRAAGHRRLDVICCDTDAYPVQRVTSAARVRLTGGGGTDLRPGLAAAAAGAELVVVLTDGRTPWPDRPPRATVVICLYGAAHPGAQHGSGDPAPSWSHMVWVKEEEK